MNGIYLTENLIHLLFSMEGFVQVGSSVICKGRGHLPGLSFYVQNIEIFKWFSSSYV